MYTSVDKHLTSKMPFIISCGFILLFPIFTTMGLFLTEPQSNSVQYKLQYQTVMVSFNVGGRFTSIIKKRVPRNFRKRGGGSIPFLIELASLLFY